LYFLLLIALKFWIYPVWTWRGYLTDVSALVSLGSSLSPVLIFVWLLRQRRTPGEAVTATLKRTLVSKSMLTWVISLLFCRRHWNIDVSHCLRRT
jgi:hypothetical protein